MKKFSHIGTEVPVAKVCTHELAVRQLIEALDIQVEGAPAPWQKDIRLVPGTAFIEALAQLVNHTFKEEKKALLEQAKRTAFTQDAAWADDALDALNETLK